MLYLFYTLIFVHFHGVPIILEWTMHVFHLKNFISQLFSLLIRWLQRSLMAAGNQPTFLLHTVAACLCLKLHDFRLLGKATAHAVYTAQKAVVFFYLEKIWYLLEWTWLMLSGTGYMGVTVRMVEDEVLRADWRRVLMIDTAVYTSGPDTARKTKLGGALRTWKT